MIGNDRVGELDFSTCVCGDLDQPRTLHGLLLFRWLDEQETAFGEIAKRSAVATVDDIGEKLRSIGVTDEWEFE